MRWIPSPFDRSAGPGVLLLSAAVAAVLVSGCAATTRRQATMADAAGVTLADASQALDAGDNARARRILEDVANNRIDTMEGALALDHLALLTGTNPLPERTYGCSSEAEAAADVAEGHFSSGRLPESRSSFAKALELCPGNARWWIHAADVEFREGHYSKAREMYRKGLAIDPWDRAGHRYLADAELALGDHREFWRQCVLAVVSDPTYEAGWEFLRQATPGLGGRFNRQYEAKPVIEVTKGNINVWMGVIREPALSLGWKSYLGARISGMARVLLSQLHGQPVSEIDNPKWSQEQRDWPTMTPMQRERYVAGRVLADYDASKDAAGPRPPRTWPTIQRAAAEGWLDEAIYMHLLDRELAPEFVEFRRKRSERLVEYVSRYLAVLP